MFGSSSKQRKAEREAARQYWTALKGAKRMESIEKPISTQGARALSNEMGDQMSYGTKRLALKADRIGREINQTLPKFREKVDAYNKRYDQLQRQMRGETVQRWEVLDKPIDKNNIGQAVSRLNQKGTIIDDRDEAMQLAQQKHAAQQQAKKAARSNPISNVAQAISGSNNSIAQMLNPVNANSYVRDASLQPLSASRSSLGGLERAGAELNDLTTQVNAQKGFLNASQKYEEIAQQLKQRLKRDLDNQPVNNRPVGLLGQADIIVPGTSPADTLRFQ